MSSPDNYKDGEVDIGQSEAPEPPSLNFFKITDDLKYGNAANFSMTAVFVTYHYFKYFRIVWEIHGLDPWNLNSKCKFGNPFGLWEKLERHSPFIKQYCLEAKYYSEEAVESMTFGKTDKRLIGATIILLLIL